MVVLLPHDRPVAADFVALAVVTAYETACLAASGATLGKRLLGLRVAALDHGGPVPPRGAFARGLVVGFCFLVAPSSIGIAFSAVLAFGLALSILLSRHRRAAHDRLAGTIVVRAAWAPAVITSEQVDRLSDAEQAPTWTAFGRTATLDERRRARAARLDDAPFLLGWIVGTALVPIVWPSSGGAVLVWLALAWFVPFVIDETWRIARYGATPGHRRYGLVVVDAASGARPSTGRSLARAAVLAMFLFVPVLIPVLALWVKASATNRGPHDLAGHTMVIAPAVATPALADGSLRRRGLTGSG